MMVRLNTFWSEPVTPVFCMGVSPCEKAPVLKIPSKKSPPMALVTQFPVERSMASVRWGTGDLARHFVRPHRKGVGGVG